MTVSKNGKKIGRPSKVSRMEVRQNEGREEPIRTAPREKRQRLQKYGDGQDRFSIPREMIPEGLDLQWVAYEILGQPAPQERIRFERNGWRAVTPDMFEGRFDGMFMPKGHRGEICVEGQVLMERPMELTMEARREERVAAMNAVGVQERRLQAGQLDGVTLDTQHPTARANTRLTRTVEAGIPVPDQ
jgi:hypothetical protein